MIYCAIEKIYSEMLSYTLMKSLQLAKRSQGTAGRLPPRPSGRLGLRPAGWPPPRGPAHEHSCPPVHQESYREFREFREFRGLGFRRFRRFRSPPGIGGRPPRRRRSPALRPGPGGPRLGLRRSCCPSWHRVLATWVLGLGNFEKRYRHRDLSGFL